MAVQVVLIVINVGKPSRPVACKRLVCWLAYPTAEVGPRNNLVAHQLILLISKQCCLLLRKYAVCGLPTAAGNARLNGPGKQLILTVELFEKTQFLLDREASDPCLGSSLAHAETFNGLLNVCERNTSLRSLDTGAPFRSVWNILHDPNHLHGHGLLVQLPA